MVYEDSNGAVIEKHEYAYNRNGQVVKETNLNNVSVNPVNETRSYAYDYMGNLLKSEITGSANVTTLYTYDKVGNRLTKKQNNVTTTYTYNGLNQLTGESGGGNSLNYVYDANGNQIRITGTADGTSVNKVFAYTPSGLMSSYTSEAGTQVNRYNGDGQRVSKTEGSDVTNYFYQDGSVLYTTDSQGNVKAFNLLNVSDILGTLRINGNNVSSYFYTEDMRGSTVNVIDNSGNTVLSYWYDDFGQVNEYRESGNSLINEVQYTGAIYDELTGLLYLNARFYDPATGRFISQDTYRGERDDAGTWHLYAYCANDPVNYVDSSGYQRVRSNSVYPTHHKKTIKYKKRNVITVSVAFDWWRSSERKQVLMYNNPQVKVKKALLTTAAIYNNEVENKYLFRDRINIKVAVGFWRFIIGSGVSSGALPRSMVILDITITGNSSKVRGMVHATKKTVSYSTYKNWNWGDY